MSGRRWPPAAGELWLAAERWPETLLEPCIRGGDLVLVLWGQEVASQDGVTSWWGGEVLAPAGKRFIKALPEDLVPADDPRIRASNHD